MVQLTESPSFVQFFFAKTTERLAGTLCIGLSLIPIPYFQVWKAEADNICGYEGTVLVGVKAAKDNAPQKEVGDLLQEMMIMQQIGPHPNVVTLLGVCVEQGEGGGKGITQPTL